MIQKTFWSSIGDLLKLDIKINIWLATVRSEGMEVFSRDQFVANDGVYITYCVVPCSLGKNENSTDY